MTEQEKQILAEVLKKVLDESEKMWNEKTRSHAHIIGFLQGTIKATVRELGGTV